MLFNLRMLIYHRLLVISNTQRRRRQEQARKEYRERSGMIYSA